MPFWHPWCRGKYKSKRGKEKCKNEKSELRKESEKDQRECRPIRNILPLRSFALRGLVVRRREVDTSRG
jgi:hypothetical protein